MPFKQVDGKKIGAAWMPGATVIGHDRSIVNIDFRRNALRLLRPTRAMFNRIEMNAIGMTNKIVVITDLMFPETALP